MIYICCCHLYAQYAPNSLPLCFPVTLKHRALSYVLAELCVLWAICFIIFFVPISKFVTILMLYSQQNSG